MRHHGSEKIERFGFYLWHLKPRLLPARRVGILGVIAIVMLTGCDPAKEEYYEGQGQAERDIAKGELKIAVAEGTNLPVFWDYTELLKTRYKIGWYISTPAWTRGYNEVALPKIEQKLGTNALSQTLADAKKLHGQ